jgi:TatD DNase family protein
MEFTDTHTHLYEDVFKNDFQAMLSRARAAKVSRFFVPNVDGSTVNELKKICQGNEGFFPMMGLHPCYVKENYPEELDLIYRELQSGKYIAVGEIGLDLYWDKTTLSMQQDAFRKQLEFSMEFKLPVAIHCRDSFREIMDIVSLPEYADCRGVFHCFTGNAEDAAEICTLGYYIGIGGVVTFKNSNLKEVLRSVPKDRIVLETDSPYLAPVPFRGKRNESAYIPYIAHVVSEALGLSVSETAWLTTENSKRLFGV